MIDMKGDESAFNGLTIREWFAGLAMQGLCANTDFTESVYEQIAVYAIKHADALVAELNRPKEQKP